MGMPESDKGWMFESISYSSYCSSVSSSLSSSPVVVFFFLALQTSGRHVRRSDGTRHYGSKYSGHCRRYRRMTGQRAPHAKTWSRDNWRICESA